MIGEIPEGHRGAHAARQQARSHAVQTLADTLAPSDGLGEIGQCGQERVPMEGRRVMRLRNCARASFRSRFMPSSVIPTASVPAALTYLGGPTSAKLGSIPAMDRTAGIDLRQPE